VIFKPDLPVSLSICLEMSPPTARLLEAGFYSFLKFTLKWSGDVRMWSPTLNQTDVKIINLKLRDDNAQDSCINFNPLSIAFNLSSS